MRPAIARIGPARPNFTARSLRRAVRAGHCRPDGPRLQGNGRLRSGGATLSVGIGQDAGRRPASPDRPSRLRENFSAAQLGAQQSRRLIGVESELTLQLQRRDAVGVGGHQIGGPEPGCQRQLGVVHDGSRSDRSLAATAGALECPGLGLQPPGLATTAARTNKPVRPSRRDQILRASRFVAEALLELDQRARKVCHEDRPGTVCPRYIL